MSVNSETQTSGRPRRSRVSRVRKAVLAIAFALFCAGVVVAGGLGDACSVGYEATAAVCPLGALEGFFGSSCPLLLAWPLVLGSRLWWSSSRDAPSALGYVPSPLFRDSCAQRSSGIASRQSRRLRPRRRLRDGRRRARVAPAAAADVCPSAGNAGGDASFEEASWARKGVKLDSRHAVLAGTLATTALCGFPVFCLLCPVRLTFATVIAFYRFVGFNEPTFDLLVFPAIVVVELVLLRKWCHRFCPIGALMSLFAPLARRLRPQVKVDACLRSTGEDCVVCGSVCPEGIDPVRDLGRRPLYECTRCGRCAEVCPTQAITFRRRRARSTDPVMIDDGQAVLLD